MTNKTMTFAAAVIAAAAMSGLTASPAAAQYGGPSNQYQDRNSQDQYQDRGPPGEYRDRGQQSRIDNAYRAGYRAGYDTARGRRRFDDRPVAIADPNERWRQRYSQS